MRRLIGLLCLLLLVSGLGTAEDNVKQLISTMSLHDKVCQLFLVKPEAILRGTDPAAPGAAIGRALARYPVAGLVYFARHLKTDDQTRDMIAQAQAFAGKTAHGIGIFTAVDEEGGAVSRFAARLGTAKAPAARDLGKGRTEEAYQAAREIGRDLASYGINLNLAPVADLDFPGVSALGSRSFGQAPDIVAAMVMAFSQGLLSHGVQATLKHFPGIGSAVGNTHLRAARSDRTLAQLRLAEFQPFREGIAGGANLVMVGHVHYSAIDASSPASLSAAIITGCLRGELGFNGVVMTDALDMKPITQAHSSGEAAVQALLAGNDLLLMPYNLTNAVKGVVKAVENGRISQARIDESVYRILSLKKEMWLIDLPES